MSLSLTCKGESIIEGQPALHKTGEFFFLNNRPCVQCTECGEVAPIPLSLDTLINYVNQLWGDRIDTIFSLISILKQQ